MSTMRFGKWTVNQSDGQKNKKKKQRYDRQLIWYARVHLNKHRPTWIDFSGDVLRNAPHIFKSMENRIIPFVYGGGKSTSEVVVKFEFYC